jgi:hypothetical protein
MVLVICCKCSFAASKLVLLAPQHEEWIGCAVHFTVSVGGDFSMGFDRVLEPVAHVRTTQPEEVPDSLGFNPMKILRALCDRIQAPASSTAKRLRGVQPPSISEHPHRSIIVFPEPLSSKARLLSATA